MDSERLDSVVEDTAAHLTPEARALWVPQRNVARVPHTIDAFTFYREYVAANVPCILTGAAASWASQMQAWGGGAAGIRRLRDSADEGAEVTVNVTPTGHGDCVVETFADTAANSAAAGTGASASAALGRLFVKPLEVRMRFRTLLDELLAANAGGGDGMRGGASAGGGCGGGDGIIGNGVPYLSHQNDNLRDAAECGSGQLRGVVDAVPAALPLASAALGNAPEAVNLWVGDGRAVSSLHKDHYENFYFVAAGEKRFALLPPCDVPYLHHARVRTASFVRGSSGGGGGGGGPRLRARLAADGSDLGVRGVRGAGGSAAGTRPSLDGGCEGQGAAGGAAWHWDIVVDEEAAGGGEGAAASAPSAVTWPLLDPCKAGAGASTGADTNARFPRLRHASVLHVRVREGEILYLPSLWFHRVGAAPGRVSVAVNFWHDMEFGARWVYFSFLQQVATAHLVLENTGLERAAAAQEAGAEARMARLAAKSAEGEAESSGARAPVLAPQSGWRGRGAEQLLAWLAERGAGGLDALRVDACCPSGRGVRAARDLAPGHTVSLPASLLITERTVRAAEFWPALDAIGRGLGEGQRAALLSPETQLALFLLAEDGRGAAVSRWRHVAEMLPSRYDQAYLWSAEELCAVRGSQLFADASRQRTQIDAAFDALLPPLRAAHPHLFGGSTRDAFFRAVAAVHSRAFLVKTVGSASGRIEGRTAALVPAIDLLNHSADAAASFVLDEGAGELLLTFRRAAAAGDELHLSYGARGNHSLLLQYGFATFPNRHDAIVLRPALHAAEAVAVAAAAAAADAAAMLLAASPAGVRTVSPCSVAYWNRCEHSMRVPCIQRLKR
eukprot:g7809.t1